MDRRVGCTRSPDERVLWCAWVSARGTDGIAQQRDAHNTDPVCVDVCGAGERMEGMPAYHGALRDVYECLGLGEWVVGL